MRQDRPTQAVIFAGGRGTRLQPLTLTRPKPMIEFHGRPFLAYLVEQLRDQGFEHIVLLLGYLPEVIQDYFGDGRDFGVRIDYSVTAPDDLTGSRIKHAAHLLDPRFLLLYCDNFWPLNMDALWRAYEARPTPAMITVYRNLDGYTRSNVRVDGEGYVREIDRSRTADGLNGVEIGYALIDRSVLRLLPEEDILFERAVYPLLAARGALRANVTNHRYYSVGSHARLPLTEEYLSGRPTVILDRDGVLNRRPAKAEYVREWSEFHWLPGAKEALSMLGSAGYRIVVVSNQAGIARGAMTVDDLEAIHRRMMLEAADAGGLISAVFYCPHHWDDGCECRKPRPGMLYQAQHTYDFDLTGATFIGDDERDGQAAEAAGCHFIFASEEQPLLSAVRGLLGTQVRSQTISV